MTHDHELSSEFYQPEYENRQKEENVVTDNAATENWIKE